MSADIVAQRSTAYWLIFVSWCTCRLSCRYELRIAELRVALEDTQQSGAPAPSPAPATVGANDTHSKSKTDSKVRDKKPRDKAKSNRSKSKDRSRRRSSSTKRSSSRRRSSGWKGDEELADRLTDAEWRAMWGLQSQVAARTLPYRLLVVDHSF